MGYPNGGTYLRGYQNWLPDGFSVKFSQRPFNSFYQSGVLYIRIYIEYNIEFRIRLIQNLAGSTFSDYLNILFGARQGSIAGSLFSMFTLAICFSKLTLLSSLAMQMIIPLNHEPRKTNKIFENHSKWGVWMVSRRVLQSQCR